MSLLTQFNTIKTNIDLANELCNDIFSPLRYSGTNANKWKFSRFDGHNKSSATHQPTLSDIPNIEPTAITYYSDGYTSQFNAGDAYMGLVECWVHCKSASTLSVTGTNDDYGAIYIDSTLQFRINKVGSSSGTLNFKKGWNHIQYVFNEVSGNDYAYINVSLSSQTFIDKMYGDLEVINYGE